MELCIALCRTDDPFFDLEREEIRGLFSEERLTHILKRHPKEQKRSAAAQWLLREQLRRYAPQLDFPPRFSYGWQDKPFLAELPDLHFNLSHSGHWAACALSPVPVGVDVQETRRVSPPLLRKFADSEREWLEGLGETERAAAVLDVWCLKEAYCKCTGDGLRTPLNETAFTLSPLTINKAGYTAYLPPQPEAGCHLAVCIRSDCSIPLKTVILTHHKGVQT